MKVSQQIEGACEFIRKHRKLNPIIAGNALWCWAANQPARDVDIWIHQGLRARLGLLRYPKIPEIHVSTGYGSTFRNEMRRGWIGSTRIDIIVHRYDDPCAIFDYKHLMVSWPAGESDRSEAIAMFDAIALFARGEFLINPRAPHPRGMKYRDRTMNNPLWGQGRAARAIAQLLKRMDTIRPPVKADGSLPRAELVTGAGWVRPSSPSGRRP